MEIQTVSVKKQKLANVNFGTEKYNNRNKLTAEAKQMTDESVSEYGDIIDQEKLSNLNKREKNENNLTDSHESEGQN